MSNIFLVQNQSKMKFILNLKELNQFIRSNHFKLGDLGTALRIVSVIVEVKDALKMHKLRVNYHVKKLYIP